MEIRQVNKEEISVIFSYYNEAKNLVRVLDLAAQQTVPPREVLLVDSGSTDNSFDIVENWIRTNSSSYATIFRNIREGTTQPSSSKNVGIRNARYGILAFMDCGLAFDRDWLEKQMEFLSSSGLDIVSGVCFFEGKSLLDKSAIAQTYGYRQLRPTVPSSLVKTSVFDRAGLFLEEKRAGYDVDWINRLASKDITRGVNRHVVINYHGTNYGDSLKKIFLKNVSYSIPTVGLYKYYYPYYYMLLVLLLAVLFLLYSTKAILFLGVYIIVRGYVIPACKSGNSGLIREEPLSILTLPLVGVVIDAGKLIGYIKGAADLIIHAVSSFFCKIREIGRRGKNVW